MTSHLLNLMAFAAVVSALFAIQMRDGLRPRVKFAAWLTSVMVGSAVLAAWVMFLLG